MKKKQNKRVRKNYSKKIMLGAFGLFAVVVVALIFIFAFANRTEYYECTLYQSGMKNGDGDIDWADQNNRYGYYRIYLEEGKKHMRLEYSIYDKEQKKYVDQKPITGFYSYEDNGLLKIDFKDNYPEEKSVIYFKKSGDKLTRVSLDPSGKIADEAYRIIDGIGAEFVRQEFKKKISW